MSKIITIIVVLAAVVLSAAQAGGVEKNIYRLDENVKGLVDSRVFEISGDIQLLDGDGQIFECENLSAPEPYPPILIAEPGYEQLGELGTGIDGIRFINAGRIRGMRRKSLVMWKIRIPEADTRLEKEYPEDMTMSLWVDWNEDGMWDRDELMVRRNINISGLLPSSKETLCVNYLTSFIVPDISEMITTGSDSKNHGQNDKIQIFDRWVRCVLSYDDADVEPDGEQLFGEVEDYLVTFKVNSRNQRKGGNGD